MKPTFIIFLTVWLSIVPAVATPKLTDIRGRKIAFKEGEEHFAQLISSLTIIDMNEWLLSQSKGLRWILDDFKIIDTTTIFLQLSDGHGGENVYFDWNQNKSHWTIIKRSPIGDWKPIKERKGDRLTNLPFKPKQAEQGRL